MMTWIVIGTVSALAVALVVGLYLRIRADDLAGMVQDDLGLMEDGD